MYEVIWDTSSFNDPADWPEDGSQPFVWSFGDNSGYANHGDYVFGWKDQSLQNILVSFKLPNRDDEGLCTVVWRWAIADLLDRTRSAMLRAAAGSSRALLR
jgi:hypothetical protein